MISGAREREGVIFFRIGPWMEEDRGKEGIIKVSDLNKGKRNNRDVNYSKKRKRREKGTGFRELIIK